MSYSVLEKNAPGLERKRKEYGFISRPHCRTCSWSRINQRRHRRAKRPTQAPLGNGYFRRRCENRKRKSHNVTRNQWMQPRRKLKVATPRIRREKRNGRFCKRWEPSSFFKSRLY